MMNYLLIAFFFSVVTSANLCGKEAILLPQLEELSKANAVFVVSWEGREGERKAVLSRVLRGAPPVSLRFLDSIGRLPGLRKLTVVAMSNLEGNEGLSLQTFDVQRNGKIRIMREKKGGAMEITIDQLFESINKKEVN